LDGSANGVVYIQGTGTGNLGTGITMDATNDGGRIKTIFSAGSTSSAGAGSLAIYDVTAGYQFVVTSTSEVHLGSGADADAGDFTVQVRGNLWANLGATINDSGGDSDTRIEGDTDANLVFVDASTDRVGIGTNSPQAQFHTTSTVRLAGIGGEGFVLSDADGDLSVTASTTLLDEGDYTPTLTNTTNVAASTAYTTYWYKIKNRVYVFGEVDIDATATGAVELRMSMPAAWPGSSWTNTYELAGTAVCGASGVASQIRGNVAGGLASFTFVATTTTNDRYSFHFSYVVNAP
jgi:hypothetical protein